MKRLDYTLFDEIEGKAKDSPRRRANYDLRTQAMDEDPAWCDTSQRMLNVLMKDWSYPFIDILTRLRQLLCSEEVAMKCSMMIWAKRLKE